MKIGFFGSPKGITPEQIFRLEKLLQKLQPTEISVGSSNASDYDFCNIVTSRFDIPINVVSLPDDYYCDVKLNRQNTIREAHDSVEKTNMIINNSDLVIHACASQQETRRLGNTLVGKLLKGQNKCLSLSPTGNEESFN
jgi:hypothetical protein